LDGLLQFRPECTDSGSHFCLVGVHLGFHSCLVGISILAFISAKISIICCISRVEWRCNYAIHS
jgi:hypothetical protein